MARFRFSFPDEPEYSIDWPTLSRDRAAQRSFLKQECALAEKRLLHLGELGRIASREFRSAAAECVIDMRNQSGGAIYQLESNRIEMGKGCFIDRDKFFDLYTHEKYHSAQANRTAIFHLLYPTKGTQRPVMLSPRAEILVKTLIERDCYSKTGFLFCYLQKGWALKDTRQLRRNRKPIESWLAENARGVLEYNNLKDKHQTRFLQDYEMQLYALSVCKQPLPEFVRPDATDIIQLGRALGLYTFGRTQKEASAWFGLDLSPENAALLAKLEQKTNTPNDTNTQSFGDYLRANNLIRPEFLGQAKAARNAARQCL